jgi:hypothetical protein
LPEKRRCKVRKSAKPIFHKFSVTPPLSWKKKSWEKLEFLTQNQNKKVEIHKMD